MKHYGEYLITDKRNMELRGESLSQLYSQMHELERKAKEVRERIEKEEREMLGLSIHYAMGKERRMAMNTWLKVEYPALRNLYPESGAVNQMHRICTEGLDPLEAEEQTDALATPHLTIQKQG